MPDLSFSPPQEEDDGRPEDHQEEDHADGHQDENNAAGLLLNFETELNFVLLNFASLTLDTEFVHLTLDTNRHRSTNCTEFCVKTEQWNLNSGVQTGV